MTIVGIGKAVRVIVLLTVSLRTPRKLATYAPMVKRTRQPIQRCCVRAHDGWGVQRWLASLTCNQMTNVLPLASSADPKLTFCTCAWFEVVSLVATA
eukprot:962522-Prymnesium_polylepis.1